MTETPHETAPAARSPRRKEGLEGMLLPELKQLAAGLGLKTSGMRKGQLVEAIKGAQVSSAPRAAGRRDQAAAPTPDPAAEQTQPEQTQPEQTQPEQTQPEQARREARSQEQPAADRPSRRRGQDAQGQGEKQPEQKQPEQKQPEQKQPEQKQPEQKQPEQKQPEQKQPAGERQSRDEQDQRDQQDRQQRDRQQDQNDGDDDQGGSRRNRRRRGRDRAQNDNRGNDNRGNDRQSDNRGNDGRQGDSRGTDRPNDRGHDRQHDRQLDRGRRGEPDLQILEDDVLAPCAGILDLLDNYAFVRTSGYLPGPDDVYVSMSMVRKHGLRRGDAVAGQVRQPREGERREKFNPLVRIDSVNGADPEAARNRVDFGKLTPVNPSERLRLETGPGDLVGRALDLVTPVGKGQRGLVLSPAKAGKTTVLQAMAASVTSNNPECHVMVVLVDERPEEVTDYSRSIKGEVISSTFDRPPSDHTLVAELALERAKRLVELGHDVVMLLDGLTRLARAYNLAAASGGRGSAGVLDAAAVHQPKKFFGAARNIENGGSLTVVATASVGGSSPTDAAILEELEGTENMELRLCRPAPGTEVFPVFDVLSSGTRREELLLSEGELTAVRQLRRSLDTLQRDAAAQRLVEQLKGSTTNLELLRSARR